MIRRVRITLHRKVLHLVDEEVMISKLERNVGVDCIGKPGEQDFKRIGNVNERHWVAFFLHQLPGFGCRLNSTLSRVGALKEKRSALSPTQVLLDHLASVRLL